MKFSAQEEYGLRCLLRLGREGGSLTIPELSRAEGISIPYAAKLMRTLRLGGCVRSARGKVGGYTLAKPLDKIVVGEALAVLGGRPFESDFCAHHAGQVEVCTNAIDCSIRSLWRAVQFAMNQVLGKTTLKDLLRNEQEMTIWVDKLVNLEVRGETGSVPRSY